MPLVNPARRPIAAAAAGQYLLLPTTISLTTTATFGSNTLKVFGHLVESQTKIDRIGSEVTLVGDVGSKFRIGIYGDNGACYPGALLLDAGVIAGDSATVQDLTCSLALPPGLYWIGGAVQVVSSVQPTMRVANIWQPSVPMSVGTATPAANQTAGAYSVSGISGALPGTFPAGQAAGFTTPRVHVRTA